MIQKIKNKIKRILVTNELYRKTFEEKGINIFSIYVYFPKIEFGKRKKNCFHEVHRTISIEIPSCIGFVWQINDYLFWSFTIRILGFGIQFSRQNGY